MKGKEIPFSQRLIRGQIGKKYVIKHYRYGVVKTKYPDMTRIVPSEKQKQCRERFRLAYAWASAIMHDSQQSAAWLPEAKRKKLSLRSLLIRKYMLNQPKAGEEQLQHTDPEPSAVAGQIMRVTPVKKAKLFKLRLLYIPPHLHSAINKSGNKKQHHRQPALLNSPPNPMPLKDSPGTKARHGP